MLLYIDAYLHKSMTIFSLYLSVCNADFKTKGFQTMFNLDHFLKSHLLRPQIQ